MAGTIIVREIKAGVHVNWLSDVSGQRLYYQISLREEMYVCRSGSVPGIEKGSLSYFT